jgi:hypothetical protein
MLERWPGLTRRPAGLGLSSSPSPADPCRATWEHSGAPSLHCPASPEHLLSPSGDTCLHLPQHLQKLLLSLLMLKRP